ncbi:hypothetical protein OUZ56_016561 [Daphnia magna]|uniref:WD repeat-containing protein 55 homolog n=1 Tax=Daphnia magna TaxID=35525 RepID=A0ABR0AQZ9_9CRUS|nr:hypothetical protein OUZ56_016561 [Daphnia magna]
MGIMENQVCLNSSSSQSVKKFYCTSDGKGYIMCVKWISENQIALAPDRGGIEHCVTDLHWNENTKYLASCMSSNGIKIWSTDSEEPVHSNNSWKHSGVHYFTCCPNLKPREDIEAERKSPNNFVFACALLYGEILIWNPLEKEQENRILRPHTHRGWVNAFWLSFSPDGRFLSSSSDYSNYIIILWSTEVSKIISSSFF